MMWAICARGTDEALGHVGFDGATVNPGRQTPFGYLLGETPGDAASPPRRRGPSSTTGSETSECPPCELWIYDGNVRSQRVAERLGADHRGTFWGFNLELEAARAESTCYVDPGSGGAAARGGAGHAGALGARRRRRRGVVARGAGFGVEWLVGRSADERLVGVARLAADAASARLRRARPRRPRSSACAVPERFDELAERLGDPGRSAVGDAGGWRSPTLGHDPSCFETPGRGAG